MNIHELRTMLDEEIIDFNQLKAILHNYAHPRGKINKWLATNELIRVKKGLYIFGEQARRKPYSIELLANLIYGPSAISLNYALSYYGLIPESVYTVTSITNKRNKMFHTPVGDFSYAYMPITKYAIGIQLQMQSNNINFLIASPEKALCDLIAFKKNLYITNENEFMALLFEDLRIDEDGFKNLSLAEIRKIEDCYQNKNLKQFIKYAAKLLGNKHA